MKKMILLDCENLFVDTSVFVKENFFDGRRLRSIFDLGKQGYFKLIFSPITIMEIKNRYRKLVKIASTVHNEVINDKKGDLRVLRNHSKSPDILVKFPSDKEICQEFNDQLDLALNESGALILDYPILSIKEVFTDYFSGNAPFDKAEKKHEFPDAFALAHMDSWCQANKCKALVFTSDKGFAAKKYPSVNITLSYEKYIEDLLKKIDPKRIDVLFQLIDRNKEKIEADIVDSVKEDLYRDDTYDNITNWVEVHNITIKQLKPTMYKTEIVKLETDRIEVEYTIDFDYKVALEIDDEESGIYDSEDHTYLFREIKKVTVKEQGSYMLLLGFDIIDEEDYDFDYKILRYNNGLPFDIPSKEW